MRVLVTGASGLVGAAAVEAFARAGWEVVAASRRTPVLPPDLLDQVTHLPLDLTDPDACVEALSAAARGGPVTHLVYAAVHEQPGLVGGWSDEAQMQTNERMLRHVLEPLARTGALEHVALLQGTKAYGAHLHAIRVPARESEPRDDHPSFYWLQEDLTRSLAARHGFAWTILRPPLVLGPAVGVAMNVVPALGAWAALRHAEGLPFSFPGGPSYVAEAVDTRVLADGLLWAATQSAARDQHFNVTNGDVFQWRDLWDATAAVLGLETGEEDPHPIAPWLEERQEAWDRLVTRHRLRAPRLLDLLGESHHYLDWQLAHQARRPPRPKLMSTIKIRSAGFAPVLDTEESLAHHLRVLVDRGVLPPS